MLQLCIKRPVYLAFFCLIFIGLGTLQACSDKSDENFQNKQTFYFEGPTMGTQYHIKVVVDKGQSVAELDQVIKARLADVNQKMSTYIDGSELSVFNRHDLNSWYSISYDLFEVLKISNEVSKKSNGAFDITIGPLVNLWGFGPDKKQNIPTDKAIVEAKTKIGHNKLQMIAVEVDPGKAAVEEFAARIKKTNDIYVDLSAVAKGFSCDLLAKDFKNRGFNDFMIEVGGELFVSGLNASAKPWTIGVEKPSILHEGALQALAISDVGVATSGDYRNYYELDGVRVSHTIAPTTGRPIDHKLVSVTVVSDTAANSDAYATALNVLGETEGFALANKLNLAAYFIVRGEAEYSIKYTPNFEQYMVE